MKHQQVSVDFWAMGKAMVTYGALTALVWLMLRLITNVFTLPRRLRAQQDSCEATLKELQRRFPDLNITEEDLKNAEKDYEELIKGNNIFDTETKKDEEIQGKDDNAVGDEQGKIGDGEECQASKEDKKTI